MIRSHGSSITITFRNGLGRSILSRASGFRASFVSIIVRSSLSMTCGRMATSNSNRASGPCASVFRIRPVMRSSWMTTRSTSPASSRRVNSMRSISRALLTPLLIRTTSMSAMARNSIQLTSPRGGIRRLGVGFLSGVGPSPFGMTDDSF